jgi:hypothetical protein
MVSTVNTELTVERNGKIARNSAGKVENWRFYEAATNEYICTAGRT